MSYFSPFRMRTVFVFILATAFCFGSTAASRAQSLPETRQIGGAVDPLLDDYKTLRRGDFNPLENNAASGVFHNQREYASPDGGELDASFNVNLESYPGNVRSTVVQPDGKILVAGYFRTVNGARHKSIVRLNADYSLDSTFSANVNGTILAVALQPDGKIIIGGAFLTVGGANRNRIARLNANGSLDATFNPGVGADNTVSDVAVQADGKILLGGNFFSVNSTNNTGIARLNADGSVDASFVSPLVRPAPSPNPPFQTPSTVYSIAVQPDGKIVIGGYIVTSYANPAPVITPVARLNTNGSYDSSFNPGSVNGYAVKVALQPDGKILFGSFFTLVNGVRSDHIARLNADGSLDVSFDPGTGADRPVNSIFLKPDGKVLVVGRFLTFNGVARNGIAQLNANGSLDTTFVPTDGFFPGLAQSVVALPNGKVLVGGVFASVFNSTDNSIKIYNPDGSADTSFGFDTAAVGGVRAIAVQPDGKILVGGNFNRVGGAERNGLARLNADGSLDASFVFGANISASGGQINSIVLQPDGKILIGGSTIAIGNTVGYSVARLNSDGTPDASFVLGNIPTSFGVSGIALQPDGKIVVVWSFYNFLNGLPSGGIARLNGDGSIDATFNSGVPASPFDSVVVQPDGKILVGGPFSFTFINSQTGGITYNGIVRLNSSGSRDVTFVPATTSTFENGRVTQVFALSLQPDGKILIGGRIFFSGTTAPIGTARLNSNGTPDPTFNSGAISSAADLARVEDVFQLPNGKILIGGLFNSIGGAAQNNVARLNADGSTDASFNSGTDNTVYKIAAQTDGKVLIGGDFETVNGVLRTSLARLLNEPSAPRTRFDFDGDGKADVSVFRPSNGTWYLLNSQSGPAGIAFGASTDKIVPADYDGDGKTDVAVYRGGTWYLQRSQAGFTGIAFGDGNDIPQPADFDGDGKSELAVYRPSNGTWYVYNPATNQTNAAQFGASEDKPVAADYDGDGRADYAVFRPSNGTWYLQRSNLGFTGIAFGEATDKPVPADYDGDGKTDVAVFRPSNGTWYLLRSTLGFSGVAFGIGTDQPTPADYDGDGKADVAVFRDGTWYLQRSAAGFSGVAFGASTDRPVPNAFIP